MGAEEAPGAVKAQGLGASPPSHEGLWAPEEWSPLEGLRPGGSFYICPDVDEDLASTRSMDDKDRRVPSSAARRTARAGPVCPTRGVAGAEPPERSAPSASRGPARGQTEALAPGPGRPANFRRCQGGGCGAERWTHVPGRCPLLAGSRKKPRPGPTPSQPLPLPWTPPSLPVFSARLLHTHIQTQDWPPRAVSLSSASFTSFLERKVETGLEQAGLEPTLPCPVWSQLLALPPAVTREPRDGARGAGSCRFPGRSGPDLRLSLTVAAGGDGSRWPSGVGSVWARSSSGVTLLASGHPVLGFLLRALGSVLISLPVPGPTCNQRRGQGAPALPASCILRCYVLVYVLCARRVHCTRKLHCNSDTRKRRAARSQHR